MNHYGRNTSPNRLKLSWQEPQLERLMYLLKWTRKDNYPTISRSLTLTTKGIKLESFHSRLPTIQPSNYMIISWRIQESCSDLISWCLDLMSSSQFWICLEVSLSRRTWFKLYSWAWVQILWLTRSLLKRVTMPSYSWLWVIIGTSK
jgi:hypothetical protein